ncbi:polysaccharide pyruvyl transferase family protein [Nitrococcus mobilis]|uniref:GumL protein n=1 Tax=Nitrococcus mobilis Nb-231 TaxID=314278 RepID=A4BRM4_9GAMM|nr:polysaccharide pyruvyl transferase family protein [Nitrococcus mobilis]EAR21595.1 GumL protein [Nitrococcus mobilis Nb-231]
MVDRLASFWCRIPSRANFGDALTPWLIRRLTGAYPRFREADDARHKFLVTGSVISLARAPCTVWGAGIMTATGTVGRGLDVCAVRGPLTRDRVRAAGIDCPPVYGDPALLLPVLYTPKEPVRHSMGLVLHFSDRPRLAGRFSLQPRTRLIDIQDPVETVIDAIGSCEWVASSSLHGLVAAHAYGRPAAWIEFRPLPSGDRSKFRDYLQAIGCPQIDPIPIRPDSIVEQSLRAHAIAPPRMSLQALIDSCPFPITL